jgi:hypothetical protein
MIFIIAVYVLAIVAGVIAGIIEDRRKASEPAR